MTYKEVEEWALNEWDKELRKEGIIFQIEKREKLALFYHLPRKIFNTLPFIEWREIRDMKIHFPLIIFLTQRGYGVREAVYKAITKDDLYDM